jgi:hypothetical protein
MQLVTIKQTAGTQTTNIPAFGQPIFATTTSTALGTGRGATLGGTTGNFGTGYGTTGAGGGIGGTRTTGTLGAGTLGAGTSQLGYGGGGIGGGGLGYGGGGATGIGGVGAAGLSYGIPVGFSTVGAPRFGSYITTLAFRPPQAVVGRVQNDVQQVVSNSTFLSSRNIQLAMDGNTVIIRGEVGDERERRLAEGMVRLTPGVRQLRNELVIRPQ